MLKKIISGGQTGADQGALHGAREAGIETGGTAPKGWRTENGECTELLRHYNLVESSEPGYAARTYINVMESDGTLVFGDPQSQGSALTIRYCVRSRKPCLSVLPVPEAMPRVLNWLSVCEIEVLNIAGNRESKNPGIHVAVKNFVIALIEKLKKE